MYPESLEIKNNALHLCGLRDKKARKFCIDLKMVYLNFLSAGSPKNVAEPPPAFQGCEMEDVWSELSCAPVSVCLSSMAPVWPTICS